MYNLNFNLLIQYLLPVPLRQIRLSAVLLSLIAPLVFLWNTFLSWKLEADIRRNCTAQTISLEDAILKLWGVTITIIDGEYVPYDYFYNLSEDYPIVYFRNQPELAEAPPYYMRNYTDYTSTEADYIVQVPVGTTEEMKNRIAVFLQKYTLAGKLFTFQTL